MYCENPGLKPYVWTIIAAMMIALILYGIINSKITARRRQKLQQDFLPFMQGAIRTGVSYNIYLGDGRKFLDVELIGIFDAYNGQFQFDWTNMLIIKQANGKRAFIRPSAVRYIEEI